MGHSTDVPIVDHVIWVTRPINQSANLCRLIGSAGGKVVQFPVIEIVAVQQSRKLNDLQSDLEASQLIIFVSRNAVLFVESAIAEIFNKIQGKQIFAMGEGTREELLKKGVQDIVCAVSGAGSEALLALAQLQPAVMDGKKVLIIRGKGGRDTIEQMLGPAGVEIKYMEVYQRVQPEIDLKVVENIWQDTPPDAIVVTSVEGLQNLFNMTNENNKENLLQTPLVVMSTRIQSVALTLGFVAEPIVASEASDSGLVRAVARVFED